jgi:hypothetical protein
MKLNKYSIDYEEYPVPGFTVGNTFEKTILAHLFFGWNLPRLATALDRAMNGNINPFIELSFRPPIMETMETYFISNCPDQASEKTTLDEWFGHHSKNNIAPIYLLW